MKVKFLRLHPNAKIPQKAHADDFCYDCWAVTEEEIAPNVWKYGLGFALEMDLSGVVNSRIRHSFDIRPRSSVWKTGLCLSNAVGTVDQGYRGEICAIFFHVLPNMPRYKVGDKICQLKVGSTIELDFEEADSLSQTERGAGGFGSSDK